MAVGCSKDDDVFEEIEVVDPPVETPEEPVVGHRDALISFYVGSTGESDMKKRTKNDPGLLGSDFIFIIDNANNVQAANWFYQKKQMIFEPDIACTQSLSW